MIKIVGLVFLLIFSSTIFSSPEKCFLGKSDTLKHYANIISTIPIYPFAIGYGISKFKNFKKDKESARTIAFKCGCTVFDDSFDKMYGTCSAF